MTPGDSVGAVNRRHILAPGNAGDLGEADPGLVAALATYTRDAAREPEVLTALAASRILVPVLAVPAEEEGVAAAGRRGEKSTDMALVTLVGTDGRRALPVFSSLAALAAWDLQARPVPVEAPRAALSAAAEGAQVLVVDVAGPTTYVVSGPALRRLAEGEACRPAYDDPRVAHEVARLCAAQPEIRAAWLVPAAGLDARIAVHLRAPGEAPSPRDGRCAAPTAGEERFDAVGAAQGFAESMRESVVLRAAVTRGLDLAVLPASTRPVGEPVYRRALLD
jgi:hypothetical protein